MIKLAKPAAKYGRWGQAGKALGAFWLLGLISNPIYYELHAPLWMMFTFLGCSIVVALLVGFADFDYEGAASESGPPEARSPSANRD